MSGSSGRFRAPGLSLGRSEFSATSKRCNRCRRMQGGNTSAYLTFTIPRGTELAIVNKLTGGVFAICDGRRQGVVDERARGAV